MSIILSSEIRASFRLFILTHALISAVFSEELDADIKQRLVPLRDVRLSLEKRKEYANEVFSLPDCENRLAGAMAKLAIPSRYNGAMDTRTREIQPLLEKIDTGNYTPEELELAREFYRWRDAEIEVVIRAKKARGELQWIIDALGEMADKRAVAFVCPILSERGAEIDIYSDGPTGTPQHSAAEALRVSTFRGLALPGAPDGYVIEDWRKWWQENRHRYPPPSPTLAELEATEGGTRPLTRTPSPPSPSATPVVPVSVSPSAPVSPSTPAEKIEIAPSAPKFSFVWLLAVAITLGLFALLARRHKT